MRNGLMALDIASCTGWAVERIGRDPLLGSEPLHSPSSHPGAVACNFIDWLVPMLEVHKPVRLVYEAPLMTMPGSGGNSKTMFSLIGLAYLAEALCYRFDIPVSQAPSNSVRKFFCGSGRADKDAVMAECRRRGLEPPDHNSGDAAALFFYALSLFYPNDYVHTFRRVAR